jgi:2-iminobutanoate/2-iminopropanoate deaminase
MIAKINYLTSNYQIMKSIQLSVILILLSACVYAQDKSVKKFNLYPQDEKEYGYTQGIRSGSLLYLSGTPGSGKTLEEQMAKSYEDIKKTLTHYGLDFKDIVKETIYTTDIDGLSKIYAKRKIFYGTEFPAATWVQVNRLLMPKAKIEIDIIAEFPVTTKKKK